VTGQVIAKEVLLRECGGSFYVRQLLLFLFVIMLLTVDLTSADVENFSERNFNKSLFAYCLFGISNINYCFSQKFELLGYICGYTNFISQNWSLSIKRRRLHRQISFGNYFRHLLFRNTFSILNILLLCNRFCISRVNQP